MKTTNPFVWILGFALTSSTLYPEYECTFSDHDYIELLASIFVTIHLSRCLIPRNVYTMSKTSYDQVLYKYTFF